MLYACREKTSRKTLQLLILVGIAGLVSSPILPGDEVKAGPYGGTLVQSALAAPKTLNPLQAMDTVATRVGELVFNGLIKFDETGRPVPDLTQRWGVSPSGLTWSFYLRRGVRFHDGSELTAADVAFTYNWFINPESKSPLAVVYEPVERFETAGRYLFRVVLKRPYSPLLFLMDKEIVPAALLAEDGMEGFGRRPVGTGPFRFSGWTASEIVLEANENYFAGRPYLDRMVIRLFSNRLASWAALLRGEIDLAEDLSLEDYALVKDDPLFQTFGYLHRFYYTVLFNLEDELFSQPEVREALDCAVNRKDLINKALEGGGVAATGPFLPGKWTYNPDVAAQSYRPERAVAILEELGWQDTDGDLIRDKEGKDLSLTLLIDRGDALKERVARRLRWQLLQAGVRMQVEPVARSELFQNRLFPGRFQAVLMQFNTGLDPDKRTSFFWHSQNIGKSNLARYANGTVDGLIEEGRRAADFKKRQSIYHRIHGLIAADRPALFLFLRKKYLAVSSRFSGIEAAPELLFRTMREWRIKNPQERR